MDGMNKTTCKRIYNDYNACILIKDWEIWHVTYTVPIKFSEQNLIF